LTDEVDTSDAGVLEFGDRLGFPLESSDGGMVGQSREL
jgi:hypothetical protein